MAKRLIVFNHKGGVSKTTSVYNIGWMLSKKHRVMLVDADPQCNLTGLVLGDDFERYYVEGATKEQNLKDGVSATFTGKPIPIGAVDCVEVPRAPNLFLLAGHANLPEYDAALTFAQTANNALTTLQNLPGAFNELLKLTEERYGIDYTLIDLNPGLSAINQNLFLSSDAFIVPTNPDPFSLMALDTLRAILPRWVLWKKNSADLFAESAYPLPPSIPKFLGSLIQRFNIRKGKAAKPYRDNIADIKDRIRDKLYPTLRAAEMTLTEEEYGVDLISAEYCLGEIPDFQGLLPKANEVGVPVYEITDAELRETGPVLAGLQEKREMFRSQFEGIADKIATMLEHA